jgi:hypothetical protein
MSNTIVQIRRSNTSLTPGTTLNAGELGYSYNASSTGNTLYIGAQTGVGTAGFAIGGAKYAYLQNFTTPGTLAANATVVVDGNSFISNTLTSGLAITASVASGSFANVLITSISNSTSATILGANGSGGGSGNELATTQAIVSYVAGKVASGATNVAAQYTWTNTQTFTNTITFSGATSIQANTVSGNSFSVSTNFIANITQVTISGIPLNANGGNGTAGYVLYSNGSTGSPYWAAAASGLTGAQIAANNWTFTNVITVANTFAVTGGYINVASNVSITNTSFVVAGNTTTAPTLTISSNSTTGIVYGNSTITGAPTIALQTNTGVPYITVANGTGGATVANLYSNGLVVGTSVVNSTAVSAALVTATGNVGLPSGANLTLSSGSRLIDSTGAQGTAGQFLASNGTGNVYWVSVNSVAYTWNAVETFNANIVMNTNTLFVGDFSNTTVNSRSNFITSTLNGSTGIYALPNGTSGAASWQAANSSNPTNASKILIATNGSTDVQLVSGINGTGTYLPLSFYTNGSQQMQLTTAGNLTLSGNAQANGFLSGNSYVSQTSFTISGNTTTAPTLTLASNSTAGITYGNSTVTGAPTFTLQTNTGVPYISVANGTGGATVANLYSNGLIVGTTVVNSSAIVTTTANVTTLNATATVYTNTISATNGSFTTVNTTTINATGTVYTNTVSAVNGSFTTVNTTTINATGTVYTNTVSAVNGSFTTVAANLTGTYANLSGQVNTGTLFVTTSANIASSNVIANTAGVFVANSTGVVNAAVHTVTGSSSVPTVNVSSSGFVAGNSTVTQAVSLNLANTTGNTTINVNSITTQYGFNVNSTVLAFTGGNVSATSANLTVQNATVSGNLYVQGTLTTINTTNLNINDNIIGLADENSPNYIAPNGQAFNVTADSIDSGFISSAPIQTATNITANTTSGSANIQMTSTAGFYVGELITGLNIPANTFITTVNAANLIMSQTATGTSSVGTANAYYTGFYGLARIASSNSYSLFVSNNQIANPTYPANTTPFGTTIGATTTLMPLSFLGVTSTQTGVQITANSTVNVNITANTLSLATSLGVGSGGTGLNTLASGSLVYGSGGTSALTALAVGSNGQVLQIVSNLPAYGGVDGGTF